MPADSREFMDNDHEVTNQYYDICESYTGRNVKTVKVQLRQVIKKDPDFLDPYLFLFDILKKEGNEPEAKKILEEAYNRVIKLITDKEGNWPDVLEWAWIKNRHIIRTIVNKAVSLWEDQKNDEALVLFRKLLKTNPGDNPGVRNYILAIRMNMSFAEYENRFNKGGYYDMESVDWFDENYKKFPDEFGWWEKVMEEYM